MKVLIILSILFLLASVHLTSAYPARFNRRQLLDHREDEQQEHNDNGNDNENQQPSDRPQKSGCACGKHDIPITQKDVDEDGFVINRPGKYCLAEDVYYKNPAHPAITVEVSSVTINMNHHKIDLWNTARQGIYLKAVHNIWIYDGIIKNSTQNGLSIADDIIVPVRATFTYPALPQNPSAAIYGISSSEIVIENMLIDKVVYGILIVNSTGHITIEKVHIYEFGNNSVLEPSPATVPPFSNVSIGAGIALIGPNTTSRLDKMQDVTVRYSEALSQKSRYGVVVMSANGVRIEDTFASAGRPAVTTPVFVRVTAAFELLDVRTAYLTRNNGRFANALLQVLYSDGIDVRNFAGVQASHNGIELAFTNNSRVEMCEVHRAAGSEPGVIVGGGVVLLGANNVHIKDCVATDFTISNVPTTVLPGGNGCGFRILATSNSSIQDSTASGNQVGFCDILGPIAVGTPEGPVPVAAGAGNVFLRNLGVGNLIQNYLGIPANEIALYNSAPTPVSPWINIAAPGF
jgi:hypothetical protein